ncbi:MAG: aminoglycoside phosphotransferase family protein [Trueperaceae bacterium]|nr:aminoglycoside phosphotransferase family protein [Trueperaceae bacterium]
MSEEPTPSRASVRRHIALLHPVEAAVALVEAGAGLPRVEEPLTERFEDSGAVPDYAGGGGGDVPRELAHLPTLSFLCCLGEIPGQDDVPTERLYLCEAFPDTRWRPESLAWSTMSDLPGLPTALVEPLRTALSWRERAVSHASTPAFDPRLWARGGLSPVLPAFMQPGFTGALAASLADHGAPVRIGEGASGEGEPLRQLRSWSLSSVWTSESYVLKLAHPVWNHEGGGTKRLAELEPSHAAAVVAGGSVATSGAAPVEWFLQERISPATDGGEASRVDVALALARLQRSCAGAQSELLALGLPDRGPGATAEALELVWRSPELNALDERSRGLLPELDALLRRKLAALEQMDVPLLLCHGDLHLGNVIAAERGAVIIDWTDASFSWPGVDLVYLIGFRDPLPETPEVLAAYAAALEGRLPEGVDPELLIRQGMELAHAFQAVSYATIEAFRPVEVRWEMDGVVRRLVSAMLERWFPET